MKPVAVCRLCIVQIYGQKRGKRAAERKLLPACQHQVKDGMEVFTMNDAGPRRRARAARSGTLTELLAADHLKPAPPSPPELAPYNELGMMSNAARPSRPRSSSTLLSDPPPLRRGAARGQPRLDESSPVFLVDHSACILCDRCISRLRRGEAKPHHRPHRQGRQRRDRVRSQRPHGRFGLRPVRRVHGLLPDHRRSPSSPSAKVKATR